ncbi:MAG: fluoride efflux transporter CrcB [Planctomycetota bacterium]
MEKLLLAGCGGFLGSSARYLVQLALIRTSERWSFPTGVLVVNALGCFVIGLLAAGAPSRLSLSEGERAFLLIGVLGGFTTFSAFGLDTFELFASHEWGRALANVALNLILGLGAVAAGVFTARWLASH